MRGRKTIPNLRAALTVMAVMVAASTAAADDQPPRTSWGAPDFSGKWVFGSLTPFQRPDELEDQTHFSPEEARAFEQGFDGYIKQRFEERAGDGFVGGDLWLDFGSYVEPDLRTSRIIDPPSGKLPEFTEAGKARNDAARTRRQAFGGPEVLMPQERCITAAAPYLRAPDNNILAIVQNADHVAILHEFAYALRVIPLRPAELPPKDDRFWKGESRGVWEGDTLVVTTSHFRPEYSLQGTGAEMTMTERFSLSGNDRLRYEFTVHDPETFTADWTVLTYMQRTDLDMYEYACHEGNYRNMSGMLAGARVQERDAASASDLSDENEPPD